MRFLAVAVLAALIVPVANAARSPVAVTACLMKAGARIVPGTDALISWVYPEITQQVFWDMDKPRQTGVGISVMFTSDATNARKLEARFDLVGTTHGHTLAQIEKALGRRGSVVWFEDQAKPVTAKQESLLRSCVG